MTRNLNQILVFILILLCFGFELPDREFFISPSGKDTNPGSKNQPFATLERAWKEASAVSGTGLKNITLWLRGGTYLIDQPMVLNPLPQHENLQVSFKACKKEKPVITGGMGLSGWVKAENGLWTAPLPSKLQSGFRELFVNGKRAIRARHPNQGYLRVKQAGEDRRTSFFFEKGDFPVPEFPSDAEVVLLHDWSISRMAVKEIDKSTGRLTAVESIGAKVPDFFTIDNWEKNPRYFLENSMEFLDANQEWFCDFRKGQIYIRLPGNEVPENVVVPVSEGLITLRGQESNCIKNVHFEGLTFSYSSWQIPDLGYCGVQACHFDPRPPVEGWSVVPPAVGAVWAENCTFTNCNFAHLGGSGVMLGTGCRNCRIVDSEIADVSGNGIMIGEGRDRKVNGEVWWKSAPGQVASCNVIENCRIADCGRQFYGAIGIWCGLVEKTVLKNNEVSNLPYSGISIGWEWSPQPTPCRENQITGNHIHHIMQALSDGGGIYMLGLQPGSVISGNHIHDVEVNAGKAESNGMFLDEGITNVVVENNLIYNIARSPLRFHKATTNLVKGNYLFCKEGIPPIRYNRTSEEDIRKVDNMVFTENETSYQQELKKIIAKWK